jgi:hypothetical protein
MSRFLPLLVGVLAMAGAANAQAPASVTMHAQLKSGRSIVVRDPDIVDGRLCGWIRADDEPAKVAARPGCVTTSKIASARLEGVRHAVGESVDGALCMAVMPLCFAKVAAIENRIVRKAIEKAQAK